MLVIAVGTLGACAARERAVGSSGDRQESPEYPSLRKVYGLPPDAPTEQIEELVAQEEALLKAMDRVEARMRSAGSWQDFGGVYLDRRGSRLEVVVNLTGRLRHYRSVLSPLVERHGRLRLVPVEFALKDLEALNKSIEAEWERLRVKGVDIVELGVDVDRNRVVMTVGKLTPRVARIVSSLFSSSALHLVEGEAATATAVTTEG